MYHVLEPLFRRSPRTRSAYDRCKRLYYALRQPDMIATFEAALADVPDAFVVQVGARGDPLHALFDRHPGWSALLIEPVPVVFERLRQNYHSDDRFIFARVAIAAEEGHFPFYFEEAIRCVRLDTLLERYGIECVDAVCIGTEGYDESVLAQLDLSRFRPKAVIYDHKHLSAEARTRARTRLTAAGYVTRRYDENTLAVRRT
jgi:hypothetical protein